MSESVADDLIQSGYRRWLLIEEAKAEAAEDAKALMAELKGQGLITKALRESFRRFRDQDNADKQEHDAMVDLYVASLTRGTRAYTRENSKIEGEQTHLDRGTPAAPSMQGGQTNPHSSLPPSSQAETKAEATDLLPGASATLPECSVGGGDDRTSVEEVHNPNLEEGVQQAPSLPDDDVPAFLLKPRGPLRPHCLNPDVCAGYGSNHCHSCLKSSELAEAS